eukprot:12890712-Alexandrium_andersonii.AAC.1
MVFSHARSRLSTQRTSSSNQGQFHSRCCHVRAQTLASRTRIASCRVLDLVGLGQWAVFV